MSKLYLLAIFCNRGMHDHGTSTNSTQRLSLPEQIDVYVISLQLDFPLHSRLIPDGLVGFRPPYDSTVEFSLVMWDGL